MKKMITVALFLMSSTSFAATDAQIMAKALLSTEVKTAIEETLSDGMYQVDERYFRGIVKGNAQPRCMGNLVMLELLFDRRVGNGEDKSEIVKCTLPIVYGACGMKPVKKVTGVGKLDCPEVSVQF